MSLSQLIQIAPPPQKPVETGSPKGWEAIQERLGIPFPRDYKDFINRYGTGTFNGFIIPYNPFAQNEYLNLTQVLDVHHQTSRRIQRDKGVAWSIVQPFELYPATGGLLPWGCTANYSDVFFWQVSGPPKTWVTIFYNLREGEYEVWKMTFTSFLVKLLSRKIESVLLPANFPPKDQQVKFRQHEAVFE